VHPGAGVSGAAEQGDGAEVEVLLAGAMRSGDPDGEGERRAVAAFRAARDAGVHKARTRRRDDWRPRERRSARRSLRATLTLGLAGLTVGGVAFAAIGTAGHSHDGHAARQREHRPVGTSAPASPAPGTASTSATPDRPATANDTEAHCAAYERVKGNGKALQSTAWQRLINAAGGEQNVAAYCARQLEQNTAKKPKKPPAQGNSTANAANPGAAKSRTPKKK